MSAGVAVYVLRMEVELEREVLRLTGAGCNPGLGSH
jgi:hypothetical protein